MRSALELGAYTFERVYVEIDEIGAEKSISPYMLVPATLNLFMALSVRPGDVRPDRVVHTRLPGEVA